RCRSQSTSKRMASRTCFSSSTINAFMRGLLPVGQRNLQDDVESAGNAGFQPHLRLFVEINSQPRGDVAQSDAAVWSAVRFQRAHGSVEHRLQPPPLPVFHAGAVIPDPDLEAIRL